MLDGCMLYTTLMLYINNKVNCTITTNALKTSFGDWLIINVVRTTSIADHEKSIKVT